MKKVFFSPLAAPLSAGSVCALAAAPAAPDDPDDELIELTQSDISRSSRAWKRYSPPLDSLKWKEVNYLGAQQNHDGQSYFSRNTFFFFV